MVSFLALFNNEDASLIWPLSRIAPLILPASSASPQSLPANTSYFILAEHDNLVDLDDVISWLDNGAEKVIVPLPWAMELVGTIVLLDVAGVSAVPDKLSSGVSAVLVRTPGVDSGFASSICRLFQKSALCAASQSDNNSLLPHVPDTSS